ncbi:MAG: Gfo/Idh/MocA family oxidoreductase [Planctomycetales bacterium]|nr:Gfo/Idh/MocA family oxidoreductase [Planctomycetales bacterium]
MVPTTRRDFLRTTTAAASAASVPYVFTSRAVRAEDKNSRKRVAAIGVGGSRGRYNRGGAVANQAAKFADMIAVCDVDKMHTSEFSAKFGNKLAQYGDYRELLEKEKPDLVTIGTPDHWHVPIAIAALKAGCDVYCEKPLTHNVYEARVIREATLNAKVATQMGTQIHAGDNYRRVVELVQSGCIGPVRECHVWVSRAWGRQSKAESEANQDRVYVEERPTTEDPIPADLDWDLWLGPAPERPFHSVYFPGPKWYRWWDFGNGTMSDLGSHWIDLPFWALKLQKPLTVEAQGPTPHPEIAPASMQVKYEYAARGDMPELQLTWYQGTNKPKIWHEGKIPKWGNGALFIGDKGMVLADYGKHTLLPEKEFADFQRPEPFIPKSRGHHAEWIHGCKTGEPTTCNFTYAGWLTEANHLGNVAFRVGKKLEWDPDNLQAKNAPEAAPLIRREYRKGWSLG